MKAQSKFADNEDEAMGENEDLGRDNGIVKLTKAEKRAKITKQRFSGMFLVTSFSDPKVHCLLTTQLYMSKPFIHWASYNHIHCLYFLCYLFSIIQMATLAANLGLGRQRQW